MAPGLSCSVACGIFLGQGSNLCPPALVGGFLTTAPPGKSQTRFLHSLQFCYLVSDRSFLLSKGAATPWLLPQVVLPPSLSLPRDLAI